MCFNVEGAGLLQHYIRAGKTRDDIVKITNQFCTQLKLQTPRVCEGITELFGVSIDGEKVTYIYI